MAYAEVSDLGRAMGTVVALLVSDPSAARWMRQLAQVWKGL